MPPSPATVLILIGSSPLLLTEPNSSDSRPIILQIPSICPRILPAPAQYSLQRQGMFRLSGLPSYTKGIVSVWL
ncbi:hypothetical protein BDW60DRAFT_181698 [Aspergillus nidulans var. acristatus]